MNARLARLVLLLAVGMALARAGVLLAAEGAESAFEAVAEVPAFLAVASGAPFSAIARAAAQRSERGRAGKLARDDDDGRRPDSPVRVTVLGHPLTVTGEYKLRVRDELDPRLDEREDDRLRGRQELEVELLYRVRETLAFFAEAKVGQEDDLDREDHADTKTETELRRGELWLLWEQIAGTELDLQLGRQRFRDAREWWWDQNLDAARLYYQRSSFDLEIGLAEELARESNLEKGLDPEADQLRRWLGRAGWQWSKRQRLELFFLSQRDRSSSPRKGQIFDEDREDDSDANLTWAGLRASGQAQLPRAKSPLGRARLDYWLDLAALRGRETRFDFDDKPNGRIKLDKRTTRDVRGWALDAGATVQMRGWGDPSLTLGYAIGSGDRDPDDGTDGSFRQTGLQRNEARFRGVNRFRYYGDLLRPELSNLGIGTVSIGFPLLEKSSLELSYHHYRQLEASRMLRGSGLDADPNGRHPGIGQELDLSLGVQQWDHIDLELNASLFRSGTAYGSSAGEIASSIDFEIGFNF